MKVIKLEVGQPVRLLRDRTGGERAGDVGILKKPHYSPPATEPVGWSVFWLRTGTSMVETPQYLEPLTT